MLFLVGLVSFMAGGFFGTLAGGSLIDSYIHARLVRLARALRYNGPIGNTAMTLVDQLDGFSSHAKGEAHHGEEN